MTGELYIGLMSGTSVDGVDAVVVEFASKSKLSVVSRHFTPFPDQLRESISKTALNNSALKTNSDSPLHLELADFYASAALRLLEKTKLKEQEIVAIANHGQTVKHQPNSTPAYSLQLGCGQRIANLTGISTITEFRQADLENGGQGAPLMPAFHQAIFNQKDPSFILNIGGIANITQLANNVVVGFDTGPGNTLLDQWVEKHQNKRFDKNGKWAASGKIQPEILDSLMQDPYLYSPFPKSTGTDYYNLDWLRSKITNLHTYSPRDVQTTLLAFTTASIKLALKQLKANRGNIYVCGGGAQNLAMMQSLSSELLPLKVSKTDDLGVPGDWVEAIGFAWLGYCFQHNIPSNLPSVTGANKAIVLGKKYLPNPKN